MKKFAVLLSALIAAAVIGTACDKNNPAPEEPDTSIAKAVEGTYDVYGIYGYSIDPPVPVRTTRGLAESEIQGKLSLTKASDEVVSLKLYEVKYSIISRAEDDGVLTVWGDIPVSGSADEVLIDYSGPFNIKDSGSSEREVNGTIRGSIETVEGSETQRSIALQIEYGYSGRNTGIEISTEK